MLKLEVSQCSVLSLSLWTFHLRNARNDVQAADSQCLYSVAPGKELLPCS